MKTSGKYILDDNGNIQECNDLEKWAEWFENSGLKRRIAFDEVGDRAVSTVFLSIDYNFIYTGKPILFETMVFKRDKEELLKQDDDFDSPRYETKEKALAGHAKILKEVKEKYDKR